MTVLATFYLLFKTDASGQAKTDVKALENQVDSLTAKGKKRSEDETKQLLQAKRQLKEVTEGVKDQRREVDKLGESFTGVIEGAVGVATAFASFASIKAGLTTAKDFNSTLLVTSQVTRQSAQDLLLWASVAQAAGGSKEGFLGTISSLYGRAAQVGIQLPPVAKLMTEYVDAIRGQSAQYQFTKLQQLGINDLQSINLFEQLANQTGTGSDTVEAAGRKAKITPEDIAAAKEFDRQWALANVSVTSFYSIAGGKIYPLLTNMVVAVGEFFDGVNRTKDAVIPLLASMLSLSTIVSIIAGNKVLGLFGKGGGAAAEGLTAINLGFAGLLSRILLIVPVLTDIYKGIFAIFGLAPQEDSFIGRSAQGVADHILHENDKITGSSPGDAYKAAAAKNQKRNQSIIGSGNLPLGIRSNNPGNLRPGGAEASYATPEAGIAAAANNLRRYGRNGYDTLESIITRWAPPGENNTEAYINAVARETGFSRGQRLDLNNPAVLQKLTTAIIRHENGSVPYSDSLIAQAIGNPVQIAQRNLLVASQQTPASFNTTTSTSGNNSNVTIGDVTVHTQATDAAGIARSVREHFSNEFRPTISTLDDGIASK